jgi:hypothetical protein
MKSLVLIILLFCIFGCTSKYVFLESRADIEGWERKKFGIYSPELGLQFSVSNSRIVFSEDEILGFNIKKSNNFEKVSSEKLIINVVAESYVDEVFISAKPTLIIEGKRIQPESVFLGQHVNTFPCQMQKLLVNEVKVLIPNKSKERFCLVYIYEVGLDVKKMFFDLIFEEYIRDDSRSILVKFTPQKRVEVITH